MLVAALDLGHGRAVDTTLVGEGRAAHEGLVVERSDVGDLGHRARQRGQRADVAAPDGCQLVVGLEREVGHDADHVGVAAALAVPVDGGLYVTGAGSHRRHRVGHCQLGIVVGVDAPGDIGRIGVGPERVTRVLEDGHQLVGERAAVGIAEDDVTGTGRACRAQAVERVLAIGPVSVEVVLRVVDHGPSLVSDPADRFGDHVQVLIERCAQHLEDVERPGLAEDGHDRGLRPHQLVEERVLGCAVVLVTGGAEGRQLGVRPGHLLGGREELDVLGVGAGPAALDEGHAVLVEHPRDTDLVREREGDVLALGPVAKRRVVEDDRPIEGRYVFGAHVALPVVCGWDD